MSDADLETIIIIVAGALSVIGMIIMMVICCKSGNKIQDGVQSRMNQEGHKRPEIDIFDDAHCITI